MLDPIYGQHFPIFEGTVGIALFGRLFRPKKKRVWGLFRGGVSPLELFIEF